MITITMRQIEAGDIVTGLSLGDEDFAPLKTYVRREAKKHQEQSLARTYGVYEDAEPNRLRAFMTLVCGEVVTDADSNNLLIDQEVRYPYRQYPAVKIARLAVDKRLHGLGIGTSLVDLAIGVAKDIICPAVGCRFIVLDAKQKSVSFYERCGFTILDTQTNRERSEPVMFIDLHKLS